MKQTLFLLASVLSLAQCSLVARQKQPQTYIDSVCSPNITVTPGATIPPCISSQTIQTECAPNGTLPIDYLASAECLCNAPSTFFADWLGCRDCILAHGGMTQRDHDTYASVLSSASSVLCSGTPTAKFDDIFSSLGVQQTPVATGGTAFSDQYPSQTAVSLYYTLSGAQGSGAITGSATAATASAATSSVATSTTNYTTKTGNTGSGSAAATPSGSKTSTSKSGATPTSGYGSGLIMAAAGGALFAAF